jgi:hypothetical protein
VSADLGTDELIAHFLQGHAPKDISQGYIVKMILESGGKMRRSQRAISAEMERLLAGGSAPKKTKARA